MVREQFSVSNQDKKSKKEAYILLFIVPILWGTTFILVKGLSELYSIFIIQGIRHLIAFIAFLPFLKRMKLLKKSTKLLALVTGTINGTAMMLQTRGMQNISASKTGFLTALYIVFVPIITRIFYRKRINLTIWLCVGMALVGSILQSLDTHETERAFLYFSFADLLVLLSSLLFGVQIVLIEHYINEVEDLVAFSGIQILVVMIVCFMGQCLIMTPSFPSIKGRDWGILIYLGLGATVIPFIFQNKGQKYVPSEQASLIFALEPVFGTLFAVWWGNETLSLEFSIGGLLILIASFLSIK